MSEQIFHATFLDPADLQLREGWLHVHNGKISALEHSAPAGGTITELPGVVIPGLIDAHIHVTFSVEHDPVGTLKAETQNEVVLRSIRNLQAHLQAGVTTVRDLGGPFGVSVDLARAVANGLLSGPRIVPSGHNITMTGGHGHAFGREADGPDAVRQAARSELKAGARVVKFMATGGVLTPGVAAGAEAMTEAELRAGAEEAHKAGVLTSTHAQGLAGIKNALRAGIDTIEHGAFDNWDDEALTLFKDRVRPRWLVPTLAAPDGILSGEGFLPGWMIEKTRPVGERHRANITEAFRAGVTLAAGTDAGTPLNPHGGLPRELELMFEVGIPLDAILIAVSTNAAAAVGLAGQTGSFAAGAAADLVALDGDPLSDVTAYARPLAVVTGGRRVR
jgi:imidazolonepropionase-like amidohydrolase